MHCTHCFKTLGVDSRMEIYDHLFNHGKAGVTELVTLTGLKQPTVSYHLKEMKNAGLLISEKAGREVYYAVAHICPHYQKECILSSVKFDAHKESQN